MIVQHTFQPALRLQILFVSQLRGFFTLKLDRLKCLTIKLLLLLIVFSEEGSFFLTICTLDVVDSFSDDTKSFVHLPLLLLKLRYLHTNQTFRIVIIQFLRTYDQHLNPVQGQLYSHQRHSPSRYLYPPTSVHTSSPHQYEYSQSPF